MNTQDKWLDRMIDSALSDPPESLNDPDFNAVKRASSENGDFPAPHKRRMLLSAAAAVLVVSLAVFAGSAVMRRAAIRHLTQEQSTLFVEEMIHGSLFDKELVPDEPWIFEDGLDTGDIVPFDI